MFKRLFWLTTGAGFGFGMSFWLTRMVKETIDRYRPERMSADLTRAVRGIGTDIREAITEARVGAAEEEARLRAHVEANRQSAGDRAQRNWRMPTAR